MSRYVQSPAMATDPLIFSVGHYLGPLHLPDADPVHQVRRGPYVEELPEQRFVVWALAQGLADRLDGTPWTRDVVIEIAGRAGVADPGAVVDGLLADDLLAEVAPEPAAARRFGSAYQLQPLMLGLGNTPDEPRRYGIGLGAEPVVTVTRTVYGLWERGHRGENLWQACESVAGVERDAGVTDPELTDPERVMAGLLTSLHHLTSTTAGFLDVAPARWPRLTAGAADD